MRTKRVALHRLTVCSRVAGGEERCAPGWKAGERERERTSGKMLLLFKLKGAWLKSHKVAFLLQVKLDVGSG